MAVRYWQTSPISWRMGTRYLLGPRQQWSTSPPKPSMIFWINWRRLPHRNSQLATETRRRSRTNSCNAENTESAEKALILTTKSTKHTKRKAGKGRISHRPTQTNTDKNIHHRDTEATEHQKNKHCLKTKWGAPDNKNKWTHSCYQPLPIPADVKHRRQHSWAFEQSFQSYSIYITTLLTDHYPDIFTYLSQLEKYRQAQTSEDVDNTFAPECTIS